jgi:hypothetical protein
VLQSTTTISFRSSLSTASIPTLMLRSIVRTSGRPMMVARPLLSRVNGVCIGGGLNAGACAGRLPHPSSWTAKHTPPTNTAVRCMSSYVLDSFGGGSLGTWPIRKMNTIFNIVPQGHKHVVERFGRLHNVVCNDDCLKRVLDVLPGAASDGSESTNLALSSMLLLQSTTPGGF